MKKIMFDDLFGLMHAVLEGRKIMTRRIATFNEVKEPVDSIDGKALLHAANKSYQMGFRDGVNSFKPTEWTNEDEEMLRDVYESLYAYQCDMRSREIDDNSRELLEQVAKEKKWLKSLRPQPKWKPTGEQLSALGSAIHPKEAGILLLKEIECLKSLYHDLKAL